MVGTAQYEGAEVFLSCLSYICFCLFNECKKLNMPVLTTDFSGSFQFRLVSMWFLKL